MRLSLRRYARSLRRRYLTARRLDTPPVLLVWWGSYGFRGGATLGDLMAVENLSALLEQRGVAHAVASHPELGLDRHFHAENLYRIRPAGKLVFVCGPLTDDPDLGDLLHVHRRSRTLAVGVSVLANQQRLARKFDRIVARDGVPGSLFDLAVSRCLPPRPAGTIFETVGLCLRGKQGEYGRARGDLSAFASDVFLRIVERTGLKPVVIDTVLSEANTPDRVERDIARSDVVLTTRMHGALLSLAAGKPVVALDQIPGGAKVASVVGKTGWPLLFRADETDAETLEAAFSSTLREGKRREIEEAQAAMARLAGEALGASAAAIEAA